MAVIRISVCLVTEYIAHKATQGHTQIVDFGFGSVLAFYPWDNQLKTNMPSCFRLS